MSLVFVVSCCSAVLPCRSVSSMTSSYNLCLSYSTANRAADQLIFGNTVAAVLHIRHSHRCNDLCSIAIILTLLSGFGSSLSDVSGFVVIGLNTTLHQSIHCINEYMRLNRLLVMPAMISLILLCVCVLSTTTGQYFERHRSLGMY